MNSWTRARITGIFFIFSLLYLGIIANLYYIQVRRASFFKDLGKQQYHVTHTVMPPRAEIFDRNLEQPLAINKETLSAFIMPSRLEAPDAIKVFLKKHFSSAYERLLRNPKLHFMYIKRRLTEEQISLLKNAHLEDIKFLNEPNRYYPIESLGPLVGITDINNHGIIGIELIHENTLAGKPTTHILEKDARSGHFYFKQETTIKGTQGSPLILSIDGTLQFLIYEELKETVEKLEAKEGAVLILNPDTGELLAMAQYPDFNPNNTEQVDIAATRNRIITDSYELGSVIKIFLALAALEENIVSPDTLIDCENTTTAVVNSTKFTTWKAHGTISFAEVMKGSNNIGVAKIALKLGPLLYEHYKRLGFDQKIGIFPGENKGYITPPAQWSKASIISLSFGYEISATLLQLAQAISVIANNGYLVTPRYIKVNPQEIISKQGPLYKPETIEALKNMLTKQTNNAGYKIIGKTGTARLLTDGKYEVNRNIFTYAGIIEKDDYKRVIITFIKEIKQKNAYASTIAWPLFEQVTNKMLLHDKILR